MTDAASGDDEAESGDETSDRNPTGDVPASEPDAAGTTPEADGSTPDPHHDVETRPDSPPTVEDSDDPEPWTVEWVLTSDDPAMMTVRDVVSSVGTVAIIGFVLFAISGVWPPLVAVQSGSMEPHMHRGDLVYLIEEDRFPPDAAVEGTGVVTYREGKDAGYWSFGNYGNVIVFRPDGGGGTPIIHRARFYVEEGENWVKRADDTYLGQYDTCAEVYSCPAPHDGFITKGDANGEYDQVGTTATGSQSTVVKPSWVIGRAKVKIPVLGYIRLWFASASTTPFGPLLRLKLAVLALAGGVVAVVGDP